MGGTALADNDDAVVHLDRCRVDTGAANAGHVLGADLNGRAVARKSERYSSLLRAVDMIRSHLSPRCKKRL
jgi:hypothetical protein